MASSSSHLEGTTMARGAGAQALDLFAAASVEIEETPATTVRRSG